MPEFIELYERRRRRLIDTAVLAVLENYGCRVPLGTICEEMKHHAFTHLVSKNEVSNSLHRLRSAGKVSGGMRYKGSRGWKLRKEGDS